MTVYSCYFYFMLGKANGANEIAFSTSEAPPTTTGVEVDASDDDADVAKRESSI